MKLKSRAIFGILLIGIVLVGVGFVSSLGSIFTNSGTGGFSGGTSGVGGLGGSGLGGYQYYSPSFNQYYSSSQISSYWPILSDMESDQCDATSDFIISIPPLGCSPMVVRSDLLEEQNVPVFCQLDAIQINPLIKVSSIKSISFKGDYPEGVAGISFHPARAAVNSYNTLLGSPLINNIGYVVIILKRNAKEAKMPERILGNLTATIYYDADEAFGTGKAEYYLPAMSDAKWATDYQKSSFWSGRGYLRVEGVSEGTARIGLYTDENNKFRDVQVKEGETSSLIYFPGFYCNAGLKVKLNSVVAPENQARLEIDGDDVWVREGSKILDGRCTVSSVSALGDDTGSVGISCPGNKINLILQRYAARISIGATEGELNIKDSVGTGLLEGEKASRNWYVGYIGKIPKLVTGDGGKDFVVLVGSNKEVEDKSYSKISENLATIIDAGKEIRYTDFKKNVEKGGTFASSVKFVVLKVGESSGIKIGSEDVKFSGVSTKSKEKQETLNNAVLMEYYGEMNQTVLDLVDIFPSEKMETGEAWGEVAMFEQIELVKKLGLQLTQANLMRKFLDTYPSSALAREYREELDKLSYYNYENAVKTIYFDNDYHTLGVWGFEGVNPDEKKVTLVVDGKEYKDVVEGRKIPMDPGNELVVGKIEPKKVSMIYYYGRDDKGEGGKTISKTIALEGAYYFKSSDSNGRNVKVKEINVNEIAYVSLIPEVKRTSTEAAFTFNIGIEKRAIELSPEKATEMIKNLNDTIERWEDINDKLGNLVTGWKGACFATSAFLMVKNTVNGFDGTSLARSKVMEKYRAICDNQHKEMTRTQCYNELADDINRDVKAYAEIMNKVNGQMDKSVDKYKSQGLFDSQIANQTAYVNDLKSSYFMGSDSITVDKENFTSSDIVTSSQARAWLAWKEVENLDENNIARQIAKKELEDAWSSAVITRRANAVATEVQDSTGGLKVSFTNAQKERVSDYWPGTTADKDYAGGIKKGDMIQGITHSDNKNYIVTLKKSVDGQSLSPDKIFEVKSGGDLVDVTNNDASEKGSKTMVQEFGKYSFRTGGECTYYNSKPEIRYYEAGNNKGFPAIVPFNLNLKGFVEGWYVYVPNSAGTLVEGAQGYKASGDVSYFKICNVGPNHLQENAGGDDLCQSFDVNTYSSVSEFIPCPSVSPKDVQKLATNARAAIRDAQRQYGQTSVNILGETLKVGSALTNTGDIDCQDFMSPEDCSFLFNVCDPVICPPSRCNLGGKMPVADVVQTGIIGSIALCLPNAKEGIKVPICLTGIHAGLDSLISILKSERECLQTSIDSGEHVGICDEITSIYLCEFFWKQVAPFVDLLIPNLVQMAYGGVNQGTRGGGEYLTITHAWDNLQKSVDYFQQSYAQNAFRAFQYKNVEEAGGEFCKAFIGTSFPTSAEALESLLEPESPSQFYAWFSQTTYSDATVPATAQYKVYYHIYAGNDRGAYYQVYLKNPPASSYYRTSPTVLVKTGYITQGESADESIDFTAPEGYKELCVRINEQEECGFKSVTSDFGLDYVQSKYIEGQAEQEITTEKACVSGTPSALSLVNPNVQAGVGDVISPQIALAGIVRVCASANPSAGVGATEGACTSNVECQAKYGAEAICELSKCVSKSENAGGTEVTTSLGGVQVNSRWRDVGYCGDSSVRCWLDSDSVKEDLKAVAAIENKSVSALVDETARMTEESVALEKDVASRLDKLREKIESKEFTNSLSGSVLKGQSISVVDSYIVGTISSVFVDGLDNIIGVGNLVPTGTNGQQAEAYYLKAHIYGLVVDGLMSISVEKPTVEDVAGSGSTASSTTKGVVIKMTTENNVLVWKFVDGTWSTSTDGVFKDVGELKGKSLDSGANDLLVIYNSYSKTKKLEISVDGKVVVSDSQLGIGGVNVEDTIKTIKDNLGVNAASSSAATSSDSVKEGDTIQAFASGMNWYLRYDSTTKLWMSSVDRGGNWYAVGEKPFGFLKAVNFSKGVELLKENNIPYTPAV